jgi:tetratricopeptide (TPR) repeat protein
MFLSCFSLVFLLSAGPMKSDPEDLENAFKSLQQAESTKDAAEIKRLSVLTAKLAREFIASPAPEGDEAKEIRTKRLAWARDIEVHTEYSLYATALTAAPAVAIDLFATLEQLNPKSKYMDIAYGSYFSALAKTGAAAKIPAVAEKALASLPENEDLLLVLADTAMNQKQTDRALNYAQRLVAVLGRHTAPEGIAVADWERKRAAAISRAHWIAGLMHCQKNSFFEGNRDLRAALPSVQGNQAMLAPTLFYLGVANYQLGKTYMRKAQVLEAVKFSEQAAAIPGALSQQAWRNAQIMKTEAGRMK